MHHLVLVKDLGVDMILGIAFIHRYHLHYDSETLGYFWKKSNNSQKGSLKVKKAQTLDSYYINFIQCDVRTNSGGWPKQIDPQNLNFFPFVFRKTPFLFKFYGHKILAGTNMEKFPTFVHN